MDKIKIYFGLIAWLIVILFILGCASKPKKKEKIEIKCKTEIECRKEYISCGASEPPN